MCLIIHKPKGVHVDLDLLHSASQFNPHGYGLMAFSGPQKISVHRHHATHFDELRRAYLQVAKYECVIHLRLCTRGNITRANTHPFRVTESIYMAHNGTLDIHCRLPGRSDSWHMVNDYLSPLLLRAPKILQSPAFQQHMAAKIGPHNRMVFMDAQLRKTVIINRPLGVDYQDLWLSNTKWFDADRFGLARSDCPNLAPRPAIKPQLKLSPTLRGSKLCPIVLSSAVAQ
ncbi:class II glutamine amidotransferase [Methylomonas sp. SURF-2]|uniref:Class II glutamine amidotransferase n=1 Tax=Methylomonas subterranea TaxID=2952225 RepID=A0ABT1TL59_9GAMM|nr:class II glutamine amidotransferase [Methylomonas sp. SURF-2]MCQ8106207.1 class II glutamine amidotransferase [Methylomonas sp. SURF-2]